ncbi:MAG: PAS domain S-box protein [Desulfobacterales bacterium]|jgi:PAS domain S-box-containing protein|nr:PAS domain S-box protein [Desulfobacteraceae bacterium]MDY0312674.1 PAS domain S-box protein [Desulfobacterales bacterium]
MSIASLSYDENSHIVIIHDRFDLPVKVTLHRGVRMDLQPNDEGWGSEIHRLRYAEQEQKRMENLLREEISRWRMLIEQSRDGIVVLDQQGKVYEANTQFAKMLGYSLQEVHDLHVWDWDAKSAKDEIRVMIDEIDPEGAHFETQHRRKDGTIIDVELSNNGAVYRGEKLIFCICRDITERKRAEKERIDLVNKLQAALAEIKTLRGILPICSHCKKIRNDKGDWEQIEVYIKEHSEVDFSHSLCPECMKKLYPEMYKPLKQMGSIGNRDK